LAVLGLLAIQMSDVGSGLDARCRCRESVLMLVLLFRFDRGAGVAIVVAAKQCRRGKGEYCKGVTGQLFAQLQREIVARNVRLGQQLSARFYRLQPASDWDRMDGKKNNKQDAFDSEIIH